MRKIIFEKNQFDVEPDMILREAREFALITNIGYDEVLPMKAEDVISGVNQIVEYLSSRSRAIDGIENDFMNLYPFHVDIEQIELNEEVLSKFDQTPTIAFKITIHFKPYLEKKY